MVKVAVLRKGKVFVGSVELALEAASLSRETMTDSGLMFIRRNEGGRLHYFISNRSGKVFDGWLPIAAQADSAVIMDPMTGRTGMGALRRVESQTQV